MCDRRSRRSSQRCSSGSRRCRAGRGPIEAFEERAMIEIKGIVHFTMPVTDVAASERFYCDILGLEVVQRVPSLGMVFLRAGTDYVVLCHSKTPIDPNPGQDIMVHHAFRIAAD